MRHIAAGLVLVLNASVIFGQPVIDQVNPDTNPLEHVGFAIRSNGVVGQVITVGLSGRLSRVELSLTKDAETTSPLIIEYCAHG